MDIRTDRSLKVCTINGDLESNQFILCGRLRYKSEIKMMSGGKL